MKISKIFTGLLISLVSASVFAVPVVLDITMDTFPEDTWFQVIDSNGTSIAFDEGLSDPFGFGGFVNAGDLTFANTGDVLSFTWDLAAGDYDLVIHDDFGDGYAGSYTLSGDSIDDFTGGAFDDFGPAVTAFTVAAAVAEPSTLALLGLGMIGLAVARRRA